MDRITLNEMEFYGYHGVLPEEKRLGQRFKVNVTLEVDLKLAGQTDDLTKTINYAEVYNICKETTEGQSYNLIEALAENISAALLTTFPTVEGLTIKVIKPDPPIPGHYQSVAVEIERRQV